MVGSVMLQTAVTNDGAPSDVRLWKSRPAFSTGVIHTVTTDSAPAGREKAAECIHAVYEGDETESD